MSDQDQYSSFVEEAKTIAKRREKPDESPHIRTQRLRDIFRNILAKNGVSGPKKYPPDLVPDACAEDTIDADTQDMKKYTAFVAQAKSAAEKRNKAGEKIESRTQRLYDIFGNILRKNGYDMPRVIPADLVPNHEGANTDADYYDDDDDYYDDDYIIAREEAWQRQYEVIEILSKKRIDFAGIGTNKAKRRLNKLAIDDPISRAIRLALEIEDKSTVAKKNRGKYREKTYEQKHKLILELRDLAVAHGWTYGVQKSGVHGVTHVIYFEIPGCEQISWHCSPTKKDGAMPPYEGAWDGKQQSTMTKIEAVAIRLLGEHNLLKA